MSSNGPGGGYIEQKLNEIRNVQYNLSSPTAREVFTHALSLLETAWLIEKQGGVTSQQSQQEAGFRTTPQVNR